MSETAPLSDTVICAVCGDSALLPATAECNWCDERFHLNQRNDTDARDCGQVWIDEQYMALQFACFGCLKPDAAPGAARATAAASGLRRQRRYKRRA